MDVVKMVRSYEISAADRVSVSGGACIGYGACPWWWIGAVGSCNKELLAACGWGWVECCGGVWNCWY